MKTKCLILGILMSISNIRGGIIDITSKPVTEVISGVVYPDGFDKDPVNSVFNLSLAHQMLEFKISESKRQPIMIAPVGTNLYMRILFSIKRGAEIISNIHEAKRPYRKCIYEQLVSNRPWINISLISDDGECVVVVIELFDSKNQLLNETIVISEEDYLKIVKDLSKATEKISPWESHYNELNCGNYLENLLRQ